MFNERTSVTQLMRGDWFIVPQFAREAGWSVVGVAGDVIMSRDDDTVTVFYTAADKPNGIGYGADVTFRRGDRVTRIRP